MQQSILIPLSQTSPSTYQLLQVAPEPVLYVTLPAIPRSAPDRTSGQFQRLYISIEPIKLSSPELSLSNFNGKPDLAQVRWNISERSPAKGMLLRGKVAPRQSP